MQFASVYHLQWREDVIINSTFSQTLFIAMRGAGKANVSLDDLKRRHIISLFGPILRVSCSFTMGQLEAESKSGVNVKRLPSVWFKQDIKLTA